MAEVFQNTPKSEILGLREGLKRWISTPSGSEKIETFLVPETEKNQTFCDFLLQPIYFLTFLLKLRVNLKKMSKRKVSGTASTAGDYFL